MPTHTPHYFAYKTSIGYLTFVEHDGHLTELSFGTHTFPDYFEEKETPLIKEAHRQVENYLHLHTKEFNLPLVPAGSEFQQQVWKELQKIPYGETRSYKDIAEAVGSPKAARAVGMACNKNPIAIIIPCHRVVGSNKSLTGYAGGLGLKEKLLVLESN